MQKLSRTWSLLKAAWLLMRKDPLLLLYSLFSIFFAGLVFFYCCIPLVPNLEADWIRILIFLVFIDFISTFFDAALVASAISRLQGENPTIGHGMGVALSQIRFIFRWSLYVCSVGLVMRMIEDKLKFFGGKATNLFGVGFSLASFFVIPVIINGKRTTMESLQESARLLKKTWGEQLISGIGIGLLKSLLLFIPSLMVIVGFFSGDMPQFLFGLFSIAVILVVSSTLSNILKAALFLYARDGHVPPGFTPELLSNVMIPR